LFGPEVFFWKVSADKLPSIAASEISGSREGKLRGCLDLPREKTKEFIRHAACQVLLLPTG
jgi:hypothetical protein